jgi:toxin secretion/phage lysis holin
MYSLQDVAGMIHFEHAWKIIIVPLVLMGFDILTGFVNAWKRKIISSSRLRSGLANKFGEMLIIIVSLFLQYSLGMPEEICKFLTIYIIIMECISILENCEKLGVKVPAWLTDKLKSVAEEGEKNGKE